MALNAGNLIRIGGLVVIVAALGACAPKGPTKVAPPPPPAPKAAAIPPKPYPPLGAAPNVTVPPVGPDGIRQTINARLSTAQTTWNLRSAYNVAALNCLKPEHGDILVGYKAYLKKHVRALSAANRAVDSTFRARHGASFIRHREAYMTSVYNYFAFPPTLARFCDASLAMSREAQTVPVGGLDAFSQRSLPQVDAVFEEFFRAYEQYRVDLAAWEAKYQPMFAPKPAPVATPAPSPTTR